jgi:hypothetical protein
MRVLSLLVFGLVVFVGPTLQAGGPVCNAIKKVFSRSNQTTTVSMSVSVTEEVSSDGSSDAYSRAYASATARAARGIKGHITSLEMPRVMQPGRRYQSGVGFSTSNPNPRTCLGTPGQTSAVCAVVRGADGWYATCVR